MEDAVNVMLLCADQVEHRADGEGDAAEKDPQKAHEGHRADRDLHADDDRPAHHEIAEEGEEPVRLQVDGCI